MEILQNNLFQKTVSVKGKSCSVQHVAAGSLPLTINSVSPQTDSSLDAHITDLLSNYIAQLPDNATRKHIARQLINSIIKSANL
mgnify:CR=1 FL=1